MLKILELSLQPATIFQSCLGVVAVPVYYPRRSDYVVVVKPLYNHDVFNFWLERNASSTRITYHNIYHGTFFIYLLWNIWCIRNLKVFQAAPFLASFAVSNASNQAIEWFFLAGPHSQSSRVKEVHIS